MKRRLIAIFVFLPAAIFILISAALVVHDGLTAWLDSAPCLLSCLPQEQLTDTPVFVILLAVVVLAVAAGIYLLTRNRDSQ